MRCASLNRRSMLFRQVIYASCGSSGATRSYLAPGIWELAVVYTTVSEICLRILARSLHCLSFERNA